MNRLKKYMSLNSPFGELIATVSDDEIQSLEFVDDQTDRSSYQKLSGYRDPSKAVETAFRDWMREGLVNIGLAPEGTVFQKSVWTALQTIPVGELRCYEWIAQSIGHPTAVRAVANAIASNPISLLIPCHRVIRKSGALGRYRWGAERKRALIEWELQRQRR
jgi:O-6-methylguanine DNA methyltransferase